MKRRLLAAALSLLPFSAFTVDLAGSSVTTKTGGQAELTAMNAQIELSAARISQISSEVTYTAKSGASITSTDQVRSGTEIEASLTIDSGAADPQTVQTTANAYLVIYDRDDQMVSVENWKVDLSDPAFLFIRTIQIPEDVQVGAIKIMIMSDRMVPLMAASEMAKK